MSLLLFDVQLAPSAIPLVSNRWCVEFRWLQDNSSQYLPKSHKLYVWLTFGYCDGKRNFRKFFSVSCGVLVWHEFQWVLRILYQGTVSVIVPRFKSFAEDFVLYHYQVTIHFCSQRWSLSVSAEVSMNTVLPFFVSPLLKHYFPNLSSLFQKNVRGHAPPDPLELLWRVVTKQECFSFDLLCSFSLLVHGSPWPARHDLSASVSRVRACHFKVLLDLIVFPVSGMIRPILLISMLKTKCCWNMMTVLIQREVLSCPLYKWLTSPAGECCRFSLIWISALWAKFVKQWNRWRFIE